MLGRATLGSLLLVALLFTASDNASTAASAPAASYVSLGDSLAWNVGYVEMYAGHLAADLGVQVNTTKLGVGGWQSSNLRYALEQGVTHRDAVSHADVVTWDIGINDLNGARIAYKSGTCGGADGQDCLRYALAMFEENWDAIIQQLLDLTAGREVTLLTFDPYRAFMDADVADGTVDVFTPYWDAASLHVHETSTAAGVGVADVYRAFNGPSGTEDADAKGYYIADNIHLSDAGNELVAGMLADLGYLPFGEDSDGDHVIDTVDNCPGVANNDQANHDRDLVDLSAYGKTFNDITWPDSDTSGDACDDDDDNDGMADAVELAGTACGGNSTDPLLRDTDGDNALDGAECVLGSSPLSAASRPPKPAVDGDRDGLSDAAETSLGTSPLRSDTDGDTIPDGVEVKGYNSDPLSLDTDQDGCEDRREIASVNQDRKVNVFDFALVAQAAGSMTMYYAPFDLTRDGSVNVLDLLLMSKQLGVCVS